MTEQYDAEKNIDKHTFFNHLMLESEVRKITNDKSFDPSDITVELKMNGEVVRISDFNEILEDWSNRIGAQIRHDVDYCKTKEALHESAEKLVREKLGNIVDQANAAENALNCVIHTLYEDRS